MTITVFPRATALPDELDRLAAEFYAREPAEAERREDAGWDKLRRRKLADDD